MTDLEIADGLRQLVREKVLSGWYPYQWIDGPRWSLTPAGGPSVVYNRAGVSTYLEMAAGG